MKNLHILAIIGAILFCGALAVGQADFQKMEVKTELAQSPALSVNVPALSEYIALPSGEVIAPLASKDPIGKEQKGFSVEVFHPPFSNS